MVVGGKGVAGRTGDRGAGGTEKREREGKSGEGEAASSSMVVVVVVVSKPHAAVAAA